METSYEERTRRIRDLHIALKDGSAVTDEALIKAVADYPLQTNTLWAAYLLMGVVAPICGCRNHLTPVLLPHVLLPLWMTSFRTKNVVAWIQHYLNQPSPFEGMETAGLEWVKGLIAKPHLIECLLKQIAYEQHQLGTIEMREQLLSHSKIAVTRIQFCYFWDEDILADYPMSILFFYFGDSASTARFETLTEAVAANDADGKIQLIVMDGSAYFDRLGKYQDWISPDDEKTQILWIYREKVVNFTKSGEPDREQYSFNTIELFNQEREL